MTLSKHKLSRKFVLYIFLLTLIITFFLILINFYIEKEEELKKLDQTFKDISSTHYESLSHSLWMVATSQVNLQLQGIITHPDIIYVEVVSETEKVYKKGEDKTKKIKFVEQTLLFNQENVGKIKVVADLEKIENRLIQNTIMLVVNQFLTILILSGVIIFIFYKEVSRHLSDIEHYFSSGNILNKPLTIDRDVSIKDELSVVVDSVNNMRNTLNQNITELENVQNDLKDLNLELENKVEEQLTQIREKDIQILQQAKMASLGEMMEHIAHQWRQPLSVITISSSNIKMDDELGVLTSKTIDELTKNIDKNAQYLSETIDTFRNFIKANKNMETVIVQDFIKNILSIINASLKNNNIELINKINSTEPIEFEIVPDELNQVILNILNNSIYILNEKKISNPWIKIDLTKKTDSLTITIEDNGGGIDENLIDHIFEPYVTTKHESVGTGLGLHIVYKIIVEKYHGKVYAKNTDEGVAFFIILPT